MFVHLHKRNSPAQATQTKNIRKREKTAKQNNKKKSAHDASCQCHAIATEMSTLHTKALVTSLL
jgi:hypothetical protein